MSTRKRLGFQGLIAARVIVAVSVLAGLGLSPLVMTNASADEVSVLGSAHPALVSDPDTRSVELGMRFSSDTAGTVTGIRFYQGPRNRGPHSGTLWAANGRKLATVRFADTHTAGWQTARFTKPVAVTADVPYVVSYSAPHGRYSADIQYFQKAVTVGHLTVPAGGGVYNYALGHYPNKNYRNSNYYVDVMFMPGGSATNPLPSPTSVPTASPTSTATPEPTPTASPTTPPSTDPPAAGADLNLPRIPWEGGPAYWKQFPNANAAGWSDPNFFPIVAWFNGISSDSEVAYDKSLGINTYSGMWEGTPYSLFKDNGVYWIGEKLNSTFTNSSTNWVGDFLDDEVDGRFSTQAGEAHLQSLKDEYGNDGHFKWANFTQMVVSTDMNQKAAQQYVNGYTDVVSLDMYWYTIPYCDQVPYRDVYLTPVSQADCRTSSSYGKMIKSLRAQDATDGKLQPVWGWVENLNGGPGSSAPAVEITPGQLKGAVMDSIINEARGIAYFNQSLSGSCQGGSIFRQSQVTANFCGAAQVAAAKQVDAQIRELASVINTQSYSYSFGPGLDTMLKTKDGSAYIFAMIDGSGKPGSRTFQLPPGVSGRTVSVVDENRTIPVDSSGKFTDNFAAEYSYHIYKITL